MKMKEYSTGHMKKGASGSGGGHDPLVKRLSKHSIASHNSLYTKDAKHGKPAQG